MIEPPPRAGESSIDDAIVRFWPFALSQLLTLYLYLDRVRGWLQRNPDPHSEVSEVQAAAAELSPIAQDAHLRNGRRISPH
jgi:hypothetical protein